MENLYWRKGIANQYPQVGIFQVEETPMNLENLSQTQLQVYLLDYMDQKLQQINSI